MTEERQELIDRFQNWLNTKPRKGIIASGCANIAEKYAEEQLNICDEIVVELSDNELKIIKYSELEQWQNEALEFDGFEGWIVKGKLLK